MTKKKVTKANQMNFGFDSTSEVKAEGENVNKKTTAVTKKVAAVEKSAPATPKKRSGKAKAGKAATAESMAAKQRDISVSEFFAKNRHLLGFDNPRNRPPMPDQRAAQANIDSAEAHYRLSYTDTGYQFTQKT